nr:MAG: replication initiator protein [Microvirus sp.]
MTCTSPFRLRLPEGQIVELPCGHCMACRIARSREWASRIIHEMGYHNGSSFITLTYSDEYLPSDSSISIPDVQKFLKRLRKDLAPKRIRYFLSGEYGDGKGERKINPHYHAIIFGLSPGLDTQLLIKQNWPYGMIDVGTVTYNSARYVAAYVLKKYDGRKADEEYQGRQPPFCLMSKGLGKQFLLDNRDQLAANGGFTVQGAPVGLPRYYKDLKVHTNPNDKQSPLIRVLDLDTAQLRSQAIENAKLTLDKYRELGTIDDNDFDWSFSENKKNARQASEAALVAKTNLYKKKL